MVLVPEVVDAVAPLGAPPVLAAGGIVNGRQVVAALALGAAGAWCGSVWLTTPESECSDEERRALIGARSRDTVRSRSRSGKPSRGLRSAWTDAWSATGNPDPLPMPLQFAISQPALEKVYAAAEAGEQGGRELATYFVGQGVGLLDAVRPAREVVYRMAEEILETVQHLQAACDD